MATQAAAHEAPARRRSMDPGQSSGGGARETCAEWREHYFRDGQKQFLVVVDSADFRHSLRIREEIGGHLRNLISESEPVKLQAPNGHEYAVEVRMEDGHMIFRSGWHAFVHAHQIEENFYILFMYRGNSRFKVQIFDSAGQERSLSCSQPPSGIFGAVHPRAPCAPNEQVVPNPRRVTSADFDYTMLPECRVTKSQDEKVCDMARTTRSEIPLYVAVMRKTNASLKNYYVYIPLGLVEHFKDEIKLEAPDKNIYTVGASKHSHDQIVLESGWNDFVASLHIQENDLLIFRSKGKTRLELRILDPSGFEKTFSCSVMENCSSSGQEMSDDSLQIVDAPPAEIIDLLNSDCDDIVRERTRESCSLQKRVTRSSAKAQKMASTSSPCTRSGYKAHKPHDRACLEPLPSNHVLNEQVVPNPRHVQTSALSNSNVSLKNSDIKTSKCFEERSPSSAQEMCDDSVQIVDPPPPEITDLVSSEDDGIVRERSTESGRYKAHEPHDRASVKFEVGSDIRGGPSQRPYILTLGTTLHGQMKKKIEEKVQALESGAPIFVKVMTMSTTGDAAMLPFCAEYASACLPDTKRAMLLQVEGKKEMRSKATFEVRRDKVRMIYGGWKEFTRQNALEVGDICLFELAKTNRRSLTMNVYLIRKSEIEP